MNAARLICSDPENTAITSTEGPWGEWTEIMGCPSGAYIDGFILQMEHNRGVNNMEVGDKNAYVENSILSFH